MTTNPTQPLRSEEHWRAVPGYEGLYEVSDQGRVRSLDRVVHYKNGQRRVHRGRMLQLSKKRRYRKVELCQNGKSTHRDVHRLVLLAFVGPCPEGQQSCHNDGDGTNNRLENLRYDTPKENRADRKRHGTEYDGPNHHSSRFTEDEVIAIRNEYALGEVTSRQLAARYGVSKSSISRLLSRATWKHVGEGADCTEMLRARAVKPKLNIEQVRKIRRLWKENIHTRKELAEKFGVSLNTIDYIVTEKTWSNV